LSVVKEEDEFAFENSREVTTNKDSSSGEKSENFGNGNYEFSEDEHKVRLLISAITY